MINERRPIRVLIVEDSPTQARKLQIVLKTLGYEIETARDGATGLERFVAAEGDFDLVLSDVVMPGLSGYDLCRRIKSHPRGRDVPVVLLTSLSKPIDVIRGLECGADNYIAKPFQEMFFASRIQAILAAQNVRAMARDEDGDDVYFMGNKLTITSSKAQILDFLGSTFEDFVHSRQREFESALAQEKQNAVAEAYRIREELALKEKETLRQSHQFLQSTLDALSNRVAILDESGTILAVNTAWRRLVDDGPMAGMACDVGENYLEACLAGSHDPANELVAIADGFRAVVSLRRDEYSHEYPCHTPREKHWFSIRMTRFGGPSPIHVVVALEDITQRKAAEEQLLHEAYHDSLTGLPNRTLFSDRLQQAGARSKRFESSRFAVLFLDLDGFKIINDSLGHMVGDQLLMLIGQRLSTGVRDVDTVARLGGDEFAVLVSDIGDNRDALLLAERIQKSLAVPFHLAGHEVFTSASIGIALSTSGYDQPIELLRDADTAMYRAKALGKAHHVVFDRAMHISVVTRLRLETDLRRAVERQEFRLEYQPIVSLESGRLTGFEALVRWDHPERGLVSPADFIPAAEETGLIVPLDLWVLREACRQMSLWRAKFPADVPWAISVNLSSKHFTQPGLIDAIDRILEETELEGRWLRLEITESAIMEHTDSAALLLQQIRERGIGLSMDDFGTGYSSLSYLHKFSFDILKIDRSFVSRIGHHGKHSEIVATIVALAHNLGMKVVAEGVETVEQSEHLRTLTCQYGQGYLFSRPVRSEAVEALLEKDVLSESYILP
jgi:diguanylate cyclase (GGDEF)-like protein